MHNQKKYRGLKWICWFCMGLILSLSISAMWVSGTWNLNRFFDVGEIYDFMESEYHSSWGNSIQEKDKQFLKISDESAFKYISFEKTKCQWKYFYIDIDELNQQNMTWNISFYRNNELVQQESVLLNPGGNIFALAVNNFNLCRIEIPGQQGISFSISKMQMYEKIPEFNGTIIVIRSLVVMICYIIISGLFFLWRRKKKNTRVNFYKPIETLQKIFQYFSNKVVLPYIEKMSLIKRRYIRIVLMLVLIVYTSIMDMQGKYFNHFYMIVIMGSICIIGIGALCIERNTRILNWKNPLAYGWFLLWSIAFVSEFVVEHRLSGVSISMLFAFSFLYFTVGNMKYPKQFIMDIAQTMKITFWFSTLFCIFCRPYAEGMRYMGASYNPAIFGMYEVATLVTFLGCLEEDIKKGKRKSQRWTNLCGAVISSFFVWKTQSFTSMAVLGLTIIIFSYRLFLKRKSDSINKVKNIMAAVLLTIGLCFGMNAALKYIPAFLGTQVTFEKDVYIYEVQEGIFGGASKALAASDNRMIEKIKSLGNMEQMSSGRTIFWKDYIRGFNLWGNYGKAIVRSRTENPHNAVIAIGYRYGIFAIIPYCIIMLYGIYYLYRGKGKKGRDILSFLYLLTMTLIAMSDNVEQPFFCVPWYIMYFMIGYSFYLAEPVKEVGELSD